MRRSAQYSFGRPIENARPKASEYTMEFKHYTEAPKTVAEAVINKKG